MAQDLGLRGAGGAETSGFSGFCELLVPGGEADSRTDDDPALGKGPPLRNRQEQALSMVGREVLEGFLGEVTPAFTSEKKQSQLFVD